MTALMWAVKYKYLDIVEYVLNNGADPTIKTDSGDNVLILALEHKLWDEQSMINLWKAVKRVSFIDVNFTNKNGHNMLHMCVRRDWEDLLKLLLTEKVAPHFTKTKLIRLIEAQRGRGELQRGDPPDARLFP
jgi:ankyrin repeat protein